MSEIVKHTPGPWVLDPQYLSEVQTEDLKTIASCWHEHADGATITVTGVLPCSLAESAANAHLIRAAPELLKLAAQYRDDLHHPPSPDSKQRRLAAIEAVIAKAEGRP